jgi:hypothetical protein
MTNEIEYETRGFYKPHFFSLYINGNFNSDLNLLSQQNLGTFVHEYTHYLQNITTIFGLRNSIFYFRYIYEVKKYIAENENLNIPLEDIPFSESLLIGKTVFDKFYGSNKTFSPEYDDLKFYIKEHTNNNSPYKTVNFDLINKGEKVETITLGNLSVKEGMARLCQSIFDNDVEHPTFPYKSVEILCGILNPQLLEDKRKLIALCLLALNSQNSALTLYELLLETRTVPELNGIELYQKFTSERWVIQSGKKISIKDFLLNSIKEFKEVLSGSIYAELYHFEKMFQNIIQYTNENTSPLLEVLYADVENTERINSLISFYGIPHIRTVDGQEFYPLGSNEEDEENNPALEFLDLLGQRVVLERLLNFNKNSICSLLPQCQLAENDTTDEHCFSTQWERVIPCTFKIVSDNWKLNKKIKSG